MAGFSNETVYADNVNFSGAKTPAVTADGQLLIGSSVAPKIRVGTLTSTGGTVTITNGAGTINLESVAETATTYQTNSGTATPAAAILNVLGGTTGITTTGAGNSVNLAGTLNVGHGGTGLSSITDHSLIVGNATSALTVLGVATNGQLPIGSTGADPVLAALTAGTGISISNGAGSISIATTGGGFTWTDVTGATQTLAVQNGYLTDRGGGVTYTLPATASIGDTIKIVGKAGLAVITPNANQQILIGSATGLAGATGTATATNAGDCIELICTTGGASSVYRAFSVVGTWTLVTS